MLQLLRGLLAANPEKRLSASKALQLSIFDKFRGNQIPAETKYHDSMGDHDTDVFDEGSPVMNSIKSLEGRSIVLRKPMDGMTSTSPSIFSIQMGSLMSKPKRPLGIINERFASNSPDKKAHIDFKPLQKHLSPCQQSIDASSKFSADEGISSPIPMQFSQVKKPGLITGGTPPLPKKHSLMGIKAQSQSGVQEN